MSDKIYWLNKDSRRFLERGYLLEDETPEQRIEDIANSAETLLNIPGWGEKFKQYMHAGYYSLSSPVWSNFGRSRGLPISCFGSYIPDQMEGIFSKVSEIAMMSKLGGGTSAYFGDIRPRGSHITSGGTATGVHHQLTVFNSTVNYVSQGNVRRGSFAAYLPIDHGDIMEFLSIRGDGNSIQDLSIGVCVSDEWMRSMLEGDKEKRKVWGAVIKKRFESGYPYLFFTDNANNAAPQVYKDKDKKIRASNLCLVGDTKIEVSVNVDGTDPVVLNIDEFCSMFKLGIWPNIFVKSYDGTKEVWSEVTCADQTGSATELIEIESENGNIIRCTPEHKILTKNRGWVCAKDLSENDILICDYDENKLKQSHTKIILEKPVAVYDITVPETQTFFANKIAVHNCNEIYLSTDEDESFVCNLSSLNLEKWDELVQTDAIETLVYFLDAVMTEFISKTDGIKFMDAPRKFAIEQRALGIGVLGWHSYLQSQMIAFESMDAKMKNAEIFRTMRERCDAATTKLAKKFGEPKLLKGYGRRNVTTLAIAPTTSSSFILGQVSPSIEPLNSNYFVKDLAKGKFTFKNPYLTKLLKEKGQDSPEVWKDVLVHGGSVQHLNFLDQTEKDVFKTFGEISQKEIIIQAAQRQKFIDQGQSLNLMISPMAKPKEVNELMIFAWEQGIKGLYYQRSANPAQELARSILACSTCEA